MDEYSPKRHDIAQLKFLCESLYHDCLTNLEESNHGWVNDPTSAINLQLNELIEHIATFALNYKIKYNEDNKLIALTHRICRNGVNQETVYFAASLMSAELIRLVFPVKIITITKVNLCLINH